MFRRFDLTALVPPLLEDFRWLSTAPNLLISKCDGLESIHRTAQTLVDGALLLSGEQTERLMAHRTGQLGRYVEILVYTVLSLADDIEDLKANIQVFDGTATRGEFDLLYKRGGNWWHMELAVKFYLGVGNCADPFNWHGPARRDTLGRKLARMNDHQLLLAQTTTGRLTLKQFGIAEVTSQALVFGRLFHPHFVWKAGSFCVPALIAANHPKGWWSEARAMPSNGRVQWRELVKSDWLAAASRDGPGPCRNPEFCKLTRPTQYSAFAETVGQGQERHRVFVVPDGWSEDFEGLA